MKRTILAIILLSSLISLTYPLAANAQIVHATPSYVYSPLTPRVGDVVNFDALWWEQYWNVNHAPRTFSYTWNFGDNTYATGVNVNHIYTKEGTYTVEVTVDDNLGTGGSSSKEIEVRGKAPVTVYISLSSDSIYTGQEVTINGNLTFNGMGVPNTLVSLSSKTYVEGATWNNIASVKTDDYGNYSAVWTPIYGTYQVKASWAGNSIYPETSTSVNLGVKGFGNLITEFSSNSTITGMNFNSTTRILSFKAEGQSGTKGYVSINFEKEPSFDPQAINVVLDNQPIEYQVDSTEQSWILYFTYSHSSHNIVVNFNGDEIPAFLPWVIPLVLLAVVVTTILCLLIYFKRRKL
jgi:hypothetical protein